jgi:Ca2+-binding RTX toxin-like protein
VICDPVTRFVANAGDGADSVDANGLSTIPAELNGEGGGDTLTGGAAADPINGGDGDDYAYGGDGNDLIDGGIGADHLYGSAGDDTVIGGEDDDYIEGDGSTTAEVTLATTDGNDTLTGDGGYDTMYGGGGDDNMDGGEGEDYVDGQDGNDLVNGGPGDDAPHGCCFSFQAGLYGGDGNDTINGGDGIDYADGQNDGDLINGDAGDDMETGNCQVASVGAQECLYTYGGLYGHGGNDTINGGDGDDDAHGGNGDDTINGNAGDDGSRNYCNGCTQSELAGGTGDDIVNGGDGNDYIRGGPDDDALNGDAGDDFIAGECDGGCDSSVGTAADTISGGDGWDTILGEDGPDTINGDSGDDRVFEYDDEAPDTVNGGTGIDDLTYASCCNPVSITLDNVANDGETAPADTKDPGDPGNNYLSDLDNVHFDDTSCNYCSDGYIGTPITIVGSSGANLLFGANGDDDITGGDGADYMSGGWGADTFHARDGYPDYIDCDEGVDTAIVDQFDTVHNCENVDRADVPSAFDTSKPPVPPVPPATTAGNPPPSDITPPVSKVTSATTVTADQLVLGVRVTVGCNEDCALSLRLLAQQSSGSATFSRVQGYNVVVGRRSIGFGKSKRNIRVRPCERKPGGAQSKVCLKRFKAALNARLAKTGKVTMKLYAVTTDRAGNRSTKTKTITIRKKR